MKNPKAKNPFSKVSDYKGILAITEGHDWKPVTRKGRFFNANYPPKSMSQKELERFWGEPTQEDTRWAESMRSPSRKRKT